MATSTELARFHVLLDQAGLKKQKANILAGQGVESSKDLTTAQIEAVCLYLQTEAEKRNAATPIIRRHRSNILNLLTGLGFTPSGWDGWQKVNEFLKRPQIAGKLLYECDLDQLKALEKKLYALLRQREEKIKAENRLAQNN